MFIIIIRQINFADLKSIGHHVYMLVSGTVYRVHIFQGCMGEYFSLIVFPIP